jgi:hypothetical protein
MRKVLWLVCLLAGIVPETAAQDAGVESVFDPGSGGRASGMAGAFTASEGDASVMVWNPAGLSAIDSAEVQLFYGAYPFGTPYATVLFGYPTAKFGTFGGAILYLGTGGIDFRDADNIITEKNRSYNRTLLLAAYSSRLPSAPLSLGAGLRLDSVRIGPDADTALSVDLGIHAQAWGKDWSRWIPWFSVPELTFGLALKEALSTGTRIGQQWEPGAFSIKTGFGYGFMVRQDPNHSFRTYLDLDIFTRKTPKPSLGIEYNFFRMFFLRTGYGWDPGFTAGAGVAWNPLPGHHLRFDYAAGFPAVGAVHKMSVSYQFGPTVDERRSTEESRRFDEIKRKIEEALEQERRIADDRIRRMRADMEAEQETNRRNELQRKIDEALELERKTADERIRKLEAEHADEITNMGRTYQEEIQKTVKASRQQADLERKKAIQEEKTRAQRRERQIREEQGKLSQDLLRAQNLLFEAENFDEAIRLLEDILKRDPENQEAKQYLLRARGGKVPASSYPPDVQEAINRGMNLLVKENKREEAIRVWEEALAKHPDNWRLFKLIRDAKKNAPAPAGTKP